MKSKPWRLENTPRQMSFLQEGLTGCIVMGLMHCGLHKEVGGWEKRATLEHKHQV